MRAVVIDGGGVIGVADRADPELPGPRAAVVAVAATGICGSDMHFVDGDLPCADGFGIGHEAVGTVVEVGAEVDRVAVGDRVAVSCITGCGRCRGCGLGDPVTCETGSAMFGIGLGLGGAQAQLLAVPAVESTVLALPDSIDDAAGVLLADNLAKGWTAAIRGDVAAGSTVLVLGLGAVGQCAVRCALTLGAARVFVFDPVAGRRARCAGFGGEPVGDDVLAHILDATGGRGVDTVIDAVATDRSLDTAFACVRIGGVVSVVGIHDPRPYPMQMLAGVYKSITLRMSIAAVPSAWRQLLPLILAGRLDTSGIITHSYPLEEAAAAYRLAAARSADCTKVMLRP